MKKPGNNLILLLIIMVLTLFTAVIAIRQSEIDHYASTDETGVPVAKNSVLTAGGPLSMTNREALVDTGVCRPAFHDDFLVNEINKIFWNMLNGIILITGMCSLGMIYTSAGNRLKAKKHTSASSGAAVLKTGMK